MYLRIEGYYTRYCADWYDADGHRHRKAFTSEDAALHFEQEQQLLALIQRAGRRLQALVQHRRAQRQRQYQPLLDAIERITALAQEDAAAHPEACRPWPDGRHYRRRTSPTSKP